jgi:hypothetical protein
VFTGKEGLGGDEPEAFACRCEKDILEEEASLLPTMLFATDKDIS